MKSLVLCHNRGEVLSFILYCFDNCMGDYNLQLPSDMPWHKWRLIEDIGSHTFFNISDFIDDIPMARTRISQRPSPWKFQTIITSTRRRCSRNLTVSVPCASLCPDWAWWQSGKYHLFRFRNLSYLSRSLSFCKIHVRLYVKTSSL